ncbi:MAG: hypothetical protein M1827_003830 [Pycnora praestabilis]|nr:MAG: hypothetical protein M1827_003830 [Pycnora praestabilis]
MQSYELRELRKANQRLKERIRALESRPAQDEEEISNEAPDVPIKPAILRQRKFKADDAPDSLYYGTGSLTEIIYEFHILSTGPQSSTLSHAVPRGVDIFAHQDAEYTPFPTMWRAQDGVGALLNCLPSDEEIFHYMRMFDRRAQSCSFPHVPDEITEISIRLFLSNKEENAFRHPDMLAMIFAGMAQGLQNGVYDLYGREWVAGAMDAEAHKGRIFIAAAMQALRMAGFMSRPTLLSVQVLIMIGPYLTNSGKFLDAWTLFGTTIRLAQSLGLHRNPLYLDPPPQLKECDLRKTLWWWMLHMDQQYSMTLGRPLGISGIGDCPPPVPIATDPVVHRVQDYINKFTLLARQILASDRLTNSKIDEFTDKLLAMKDTLPEIVQFTESWLDESKEIPPWPLDAIAAVFFGKTHNYLILLNRQWQENARRDSNDSGVQFAPTDIPRGRDRVLSSCRELLHAFAFFHTRVRAAMVCWTMGQQAFNAAMILTLAMLEDNHLNDLPAVTQAYSTFVEMQQKGIHKLAGVAIQKLSALMSNLKRPADTRDLPGEPVMSGHGMILLEDPGLQGAIREGFAPLSFEMVGDNLPQQGMNRNPWAARFMGADDYLMSGGFQNDNAFTTTAKGRFAIPTSQPGRISPTSLQPQPQTHLHIQPPIAGRRADDMSEAVLYGTGDTPPATHQDPPHPSPPPPLSRPISYTNPPGLAEQEVIHDVLPSPQGLNIDAQYGDGFEPYGPSEFFSSH